MAQEQTLPLPPRVLDLHWNRNTCTAVLGLGDLCELHLLSQHQYYISQNATSGSIVSVSGRIPNTWALLLIFRVIHGGFLPPFPYSTISSLDTICRYHRLYAFHRGSLSCWGPWSYRFVFSLLTFGKQPTFGNSWYKLTACSSVTGALASSLPVGINPFWKLSFVFKCLTDSVVLDDFKTALDRLRAFKISRLGSFALDNAENGRALPIDSANGWPGSHARSKPETSVPSSPDGDELSQQSTWPAGKQNPSQAEGSNQRTREKQEMSQIRESPGDSEVARNDSGSPILRPQSSWLRDSGEGDYAQAVREVTRSSQSEPSHTERDAATGRAR